MNEEIWIHKKTGNRYKVMGRAIDCTNERDGQNVVIYKRVSPEPGTEGLIFVREIEEFKEKFTYEAMDK